MRRSIRSHTVVPLVVALLAAACGGAPATRSGDVPTYRGDAARTGVMPGPGPRTQPELAWSFQADAPIRSSVAVVGGTVFVVTAEGTVTALALRTGSVTWSASLGAPTEHPTPLVLDGSVVVGDSLGVVHALDAATGSERWRTSTDGPIGGAAVALGAELFVSTERGTAYALDGASGTVRWQAALGSAAARSPAASGELVWWPVAGDSLIALRAKDGSVAWRAALGDGDVDAGAGGTPTVAGGLVFAVTGLDGDDPAARAVVALDATTGEERWRRSSPEREQLYAPAVADGHAYFVGEDRTVAAVDAATGGELWTSTTDATIDAVPAIWAGIIYVANLGGSIIAIDAGTGAGLWDVEIVGVPYAPVVTGGLVLVGTNVGVLYAYGTPE